MKKILFTILSCLIFITTLTCKTYAQEEYESYEEIILSSGKLVRDFTENDMNELYSKMPTPGFSFEYYIIPANTNVEASYIATVKECLKNDGETNIEITVSYQVETNTKVSFTSSGEFSNASSSVIKQFKSQTSVKAGVSYNKTTSKSVKETKNIKLVVEPHSQYILFTQGKLRVSNGVGRFYMFGRCMYEGCYEYIVLESQYGVFEKKSL